MLVEKSVIVKFANAVKLENVMLQCPNEDRTTSTVVASLGPSTQYVVKRGFNVFQTDTTLENERNVKTR